LADLVLGRLPAPRAGGELMLYKSVGVGLEDIALAGHAYRKLQG
jgi:ornithine cyclodeaminase